MIILGIACLVAGALLGIHILWIIGAILAIVGVVLLILGSFGGYRLGGRRHYY